MLGITLVLTENVENGGQTAKQKEKRGTQRHGNENRKRKRWKTAGRGVRGCGEKKQKRKSQRDRKHEE